MKYTVLCDTQEQKGWLFKASKYCSGTVRTKLPTGDYTIEGHEKDVIIERKGSTGEFAHNIIEDRFERELQRMDDYAHAFMVLEFTMKDIINFPKNSGIPSHLWPDLKVTSFFLLKRLLEFQFRYKTHIILAGSHGKDVASSIFKRTIEYYEKKPTRRRKTTAVS